MKVAFILENAPDCELAREEVDISPDKVTEYLRLMLRTWTVNVGDTIKIQEVE